MIHSVNWNMEFPERTLLELCILPKFLNYFGIHVRASSPVPPGCHDVGTIADDILFETVLSRSLPKIVEIY